MLNKEHPSYKSWDGMRQRCNNPNNKDYKHYGGRGINCHHSWGNFRTFLKDMGDKPLGYSLDRIRNNEDYSPSNCKWSTPREQSLNRRDSVKVIGVYFIKTKQRWVALTPRVKGVLKTLGTFKTNLAACYCRWHYDQTVKD